jgi:hypothetical protein
MSFSALCCKGIWLPQHRSSLDRAGSWFVQSGIQEPNGGVARYYRADLQKNALVSTEITGYTVSALIYLYERYKDEQILAAAIRAGRFLADRAWDRKLKTFPFEHSDNGTQPQALAYFFDCGIIVRGLLALWRTTADPVLLDRARETGLSMLRDFGGDRSGFHPIVTLPDKEPLPYTQQWSRSPGCYQLKSAMAWQELFEVTGETEFRDGYELALAAAIESEDGFLPAETPDKTMDRLHSYCYFLEGMMPHADRPMCREALDKGISRTSKYLRVIAPVFERSDVYAQLLRVRLFASSLAGLPLAEAEATEEATRIREFQCEDADPRIHGGFYFGRKAEGMLPFVNPVSTAFCLQAQDMWHERAKAARLETRTLI